MIPTVRLLPGRGKSVERCLFGIGRQIHVPTEDRSSTSLHLSNTVLIQFPALYSSILSHEGIAISTHITSLYDILLQTAQSLLGGFKDVVVLAHRESKVILGDVGVRIGVELRRGDRGDTDFVDEEPAKLEVARATGHMRREGIVLGKFDGGHVRKDEVAALRIRVLGN